MARISRGRTSNMFVAITTAIAVSTLHSMATIFSVPVHDPTAIPWWHSTGRGVGGGVLVDQTPPLSKSDLQRPTASTLQLPKTNDATVVTSTNTEESKSTQQLLSNRIDLYSCPNHRLRVAPKVNYLVGMGHKMTEVFHVFWYAMTRGHCFCFDTEHFGNDMDLYHLLLEPVFPSCQTEFPNRPFKETTIRTLEQQNLVELLAAAQEQNETSTSSSSPIQWIYPNMGDVWPTAQQKKMPLGRGDVMAFVDGFLRDNRLVEEVMHPWYVNHKTIGNVFQKRNDTTTSKADVDGEDKVVNAAFHLRVGDLVLEASESYWRNVFTATRQIVDLEHSPDHVVHIYWVYFKAAFNGGLGDWMRKNLAKNVVGEWPSQPNMLPGSHVFLAQLCDEFANIRCYWKMGTNILETIDLFVESDLVYVSGSSFSQVLSLFNRGIRLQALPKEINYFGTATKGSVPFLQTSTGAFSSLRHYYVDGTGDLFDEQYAHLRLQPPNRISATMARNNTK